MTIGADGEKELPGEEKRVGNPVIDAGQVSVKGIELAVDVDLNHGDEQELQAREVLQVQQQQAQSGTAAVRWERFLHIRSIKVLLVENDDSTRHVVTALLRNCNYDVVKAANGVQAWRILVDLNNHVDLVLTEVVMPCLSGIGLLCKIMSHKTRKNIPVIMMSSHDSMGLVFKCLSKGAVDFLVKPIRKNELKNLWQHVWRRCHSSSGSGSESGTQTQNSVSKGSEKSDNNNGRNSGEDNGSNGLNNGDGSDDGSGTQSSWAKLPVDTDSSQAASPLDQVAECLDSTCAQVIRPNAEIFGNKRGHTMADREEQEEEKPGDKDLVPGTSANLEPQPKNSVCDAQIDSNENHICQSSKAVSNNNIDMGSTTNKFPLNPLFFTSESTLTINGLQPSAFKIMKNDQRNTPLHDTLLKPIDMQSSSVLSPTRGLHQEHQMQHIQHYHHHHHHYFHNFEPQQAISEHHDKSSVKKLVIDSPHCGSSNVLVGPGDGNPGNYSLNRSASGSNYGSKGQNGSSNAVNTGGTNGESNTGLGGTSGSGEVHGSGYGNKIDQNKLAQREAALSKFRQKRKERCFKKKVRYQNRKRLEEQRPRVLVQFVRQADEENSNNDADD